MTRRTADEVRRLSEQRIRDEEITRQRRLDEERARSKRVEDEVNRRVEGNHEL